MVAMQPNVDVCYSQQAHSSAKQPVHQVPHTPGLHPSDASSTELLPVLEAEMF